MMEPPPAASPDEEARRYLREAHALHASGQIEAALAAGRRAVEVAPRLADAWVYVGTTLVTRRLAFREGLAALERAVHLAPADPGALYSLGWCYEFVAYRLEKQPGRPYRDPAQLYELAAATLQRCIDLEPDPGLKDDAEKLRDTILDRL